ncbi:MAG: thermopsin family protease [Candidatus Micrarchaeota archaeon]|nr:thermopsin family protease [Candidatus Micrarchaeota archaeon]
MHRMHDPDRPRRNAFDKVLRGSIAAGLALAVAAGGLVYRYEHRHDAVALKSLIAISAPLSLPTGIASYGNPPQYSYTIPAELAEKAISGRKGVSVPSMTTEYTKGVAGTVTFNAPIVMERSTLRPDAKKNPLTKLFKGNPKKSFSVQLNATVRSVHDGKAHTDWLQAVAKIDTANHTITFGTETWNDWLTLNKKNGVWMSSWDHGTTRMGKKDAMLDVPITETRQYATPMSIRLGIRVKVEMSHPVVYYAYSVKEGDGTAPASDSGWTAIKLPQKADSANISVNKRHDAEVVIVGGWNGYSAVFKPGGLNANLALYELKKGRMMPFQYTVDFGRGTQEGAVNLRIENADGTVHAVVGNPDPMILSARR